MPSGTIGALTGLVALVVGVLAWVYPDPGNQVSTTEERASYVARVDGVCRRINKGLLASLEQPRSTTQYAAQMQRSANAYNRVLQVWAAMEPPREADMRLLRPALDALESMIFSMREVADWMRLRDVRSASAEYERMRRYGQDFRRSARVYGFRACLVLAPE